MTVEEMISRKVVLSKNMSITLKDGSNHTTIVVGTYKKSGRSVDLYRFDRVLSEKEREELLA